MSSITGDRTAPTRRLSVDGVDIEVEVDAPLVHEVLLPRLTALTRAPRRRRRVVVFLVAPPGAGKSTLAALVREEAAAQGLAVDAVGIDGFHHPAAYLRDHVRETPSGPVPLASVKGAPDTFDVTALLDHLGRARDADTTWPVYDRHRHDVSTKQVPITGDLLLVEGTWLLLDEEPWSQAAAHADDVVFLDAEPDLLRERLVARKVRGGLTRADAEAFHARSDGPNVKRVLSHSDRSRIDLLLRLQTDGTITRGGHP